MEFKAGEEISIEIFLGVPEEDKQKILKDMHDRGVLAPLKHFLETMPSPYHDPDKDGLFVEGLVTGWALGAQAHERASLERAIALIRHERETPGENVVDPDRMDLH